MGLGLLGRGVADVAFLAECGAELLVTDLKTEKELASSLSQLQNFKTSKPLNFVLGKHRLEDFRDRDFILKGAGVPLDSPFIAEARKHGVPIEMDASLFLKLAPEICFIGITGTRGKTTTTSLLYEILKTAGKRTHLAGNIKGIATLPLLKKVKKGDFVVAELDSWQLQGFHDAKISPQVAVFTTFLPDHLNYYKGDLDRYFSDKENIYKYQKPGDSFVVGEDVASRIKNSKVKFKIARRSDVPAGWKLKILGEHNRLNVACAIVAGRELRISDSVIKKAVESFKAVPGRLQYLKTIRGVKVYNDNNATTPDATIVALRALSTKSEIRNPKQIQNPKSQKGKNIILIMGGADKGLDMSGLVEEMPRHCKAVVFLKGTGTKKLIINYQLSIINQFPIFKKETLKECVEEALRLAKKGDIVLFSPAFASFGKWFKNEYDRGEQFVKLVSRL